MLLSCLLITPILGIFAILINKDWITLRGIKLIALTASILNLVISLLIFILFDFSTNQFQFVQEYHEVGYFDFYLGIDGLSIYFIILTTMLITISLLSNWKSISEIVESYIIIILLLETLLLLVFLVLDILLFYIFFESILPPLFILIGIFGSDNRVKASFYLFLYTLLGSLFLLLSILAMSSIMSTTDFDTIFKGNFIYLTQLFLFYGIFIAFAVKTPTIFLNIWLLKAHVESPLGGSIILAAIVLKLSLYGILRLILPVLPKAYLEYTNIVYLIGVITIAYASISTLRTIDVKELIAYSSVSHAAVYLLGIFSNSILGIEGSLNLGLAHGLVSPGLFICAGGVLYDRSHTRLISFYRGMAQLMPLFAILFFILCLANCGAPLTLNFVGEFMSLYGVFERSSLFGVLASSSIVFSAAYTILMYQRITLGGSYSRMFTVNITDLNIREFTILLTLVLPTVIFGIYTGPILDGMNYAVSTLIYYYDSNVIHCDGLMDWELYFQDSASPQMEALVKLHDNIMYNLAIITSFNITKSPKRLLKNWELIFSCFRWKAHNIILYSKNIGVLYLICIILTGLAGTVFYVFMRLFILQPGVQSITDNQFYNDFIIIYTITMLYLICMLALIGDIPLKHLNKSMLSDILYNIMSRLCNRVYKIIYFLFTDPIYLTVNIRNVYLAYVFIVGILHIFLLFTVLTSTFEVWFLNLYLYFQSEYVYIIGDGSGDTGDPGNGGQLPGSGDPGDPGNGGQLPGGSGGSDGNDPGKHYTGKGKGRATDEEVRRMEGLPESPQGYPNSPEGCSNQDYTKAQIEYDENLAREMQAQEIRKAEIKGHKVSFQNHMLEHNNLQDQLGNPKNSNNPELKAQKAYEMQQYTIEKGKYTEKKAEYISDFGNITESSDSYSTSSSEYSEEEVPSKRPRNS